ncbi:MAG TPA: gliding motility-associated C-terminal domain-containing protein, partial [Flavobacteriales bacterium]
GTPDAAGVWTAPGGGPSDGTLDPATGAGGTYTYVVLGTGPCASASALVEVQLAQPANAGSDGAITLCVDADPVDLFTLLGGTPDAQGIWYDPTGVVTTAILDPATAAAGSYGYLVEAPAPCGNAQAQVLVSIIDLPALAVQVSATEGCAPLEVTFSAGEALPADYTWNLGPAGIWTDPSPTVVLSEPGSYSVELTVDAGGTCATNIVVPGLVVVHAQPTAAFSIVQPSNVAGQVLVQLHNTSSDAQSYLWDLGGQGGSTVEHPAAFFPADVDTVFTICLAAFASQSCADSICQQLVLEGGLQVRVPNAFTPDGDGINDGFMPIVVGIAADDYEFMIFDRWGSPLFRSGTPGQAWDGRSLSGDEVPQGVFIWKLWTREGRTGDRVERIGHVTLLR